MKAQLQTQIVCQYDDETWDKIEKMLHKQKKLNQKYKDDCLRERAEYYDLEASQLDQQEILDLEENNYELCTQVRYDKMDCKDKIEEIRKEIMAIDVKIQELKKIERSLQPPQIKPKKSFVAMSKFQMPKEDEKILVRANSSNDPDMLILESQVYECINSKQIEKAVKMETPSQELTNEFEFLQIMSQKSQPDKKVKKSSQARKSRSPTPRRGGKKQSQNAFNIQ